MSQMMRDDEARGELVVQINACESRRFRKTASLSATMLTADELGVRASGDVMFALVQDAAAVVLFVQRPDFNYAELRFSRSKKGLVPCARFPEKNFAEWFARITQLWSL